MHVFSHYRSYISTQQAKHPFIKTPVGVQTQQMPTTEQLRTTRTDHHDCGYQQLPMHLNNSNAAAYCYNITASYTSTLFINATTPFIDAVAHSNNLSTLQQHAAICSNVATVHNNNAITCNNYVHSSL